MTRPDNADSVPEAPPTKRDLSEGVLRGRTQALICDLDNTLFDSVRAWAAGFGAMVRAIEGAGLVDRASLLQAFKRLHVEYGTTELRDSIGLLVDLRPRDAGWVQALRRGAAAYRRAYAATLRLYPGVRKTLRALREQRGLAIIGYTESAATVSEARVRYLGIDELLDTLFVSADPDVDTARRVPGLTLWPITRLPCRFAHVRRLAPDLVKPNPQALLSILASCGIESEPDRVIYVGDHLHKDVWMASQAGVTGVWARYGTSRLPDDAALLAEVCHWPATAGRGDQPFEGVEPPHTIDAFSDLLFLRSSVIPALVSKRNRK